jgi:C-terminal processing protease CtpA/Prc
MLGKATSDVQAALVIAKLVDAFDDPHVELRFGPPPPSATLVPRLSSVDGVTVATDSCAEAHYAEGRAATRLAYPQAPGWVQVSEAPFLAGTMGDIGIIRIAAFGEDRYLAACKAAAKPNMDARALQLATRAELNRQLTDLIAKLRARGMTKLVIDVTGNGGGSEWSSEVAAMLASGSLKRNAPRLAGPTCDRSSVWQGKRPCPVYAKPAEIETMRGTAVWTGPLAVLADHRTASAAEEFITWLKDNGRATIAGERSFGAGCGYVDGGHAIALKAAALHIMVPNCSRYTGEGINEIEGIAPHVTIDWSSTKGGDMPAVLEDLFEPR